MTKITLGGEKKNIQLTLNFPEPKEETENTKNELAKVFSLVNYKSKKEIEQFYEVVRRLSSHIQ